MTRFLGAIAVLGLLAMAGRALVADAASGGRIYRNAGCRIRGIEVPRGWEQVPPSQISYPRILMLALFDGGRMTLGVERVLQGTGALELAADAVAQLRKQGWDDPAITGDATSTTADSSSALSSAIEPVLVEAQLAQGRQTMRQAYLVSGDLAYVLTVVTANVSKGEVLHEFMRMLRSLQLDPVLRSDAGLPVVERSSRCK